MDHQSKNSQQLKQFKMGNCCTRAKSTINLLSTRCDFFVLSTQLEYKLLIWDYILNHSTHSTSPLQHQRAVIAEEFCYVPPSGTHSCELTENILQTKKCLKVSLLICMKNKTRQLWLITDEETGGHETKFSDINVFETAMFTFIMCEH